MEIRSVLFGAGRGKRLRPLTDRVPKPALPVLDVPLAAWGLARLIDAAPPVVVNGSHLADHLVSQLELLPFTGWDAFVERPEGYGTAGTLRALRERFGSTVLTCNGDLVADLDPADLLEAHAAAGCLGTLGVRAVSRGADLEVAGSRVTGFIDRRREDRAGAQFLGLAAFERGALDDLPDHRPAGLGETLLKELAERGALASWETSGYWKDVGTPRAYLDVSLDVLYGRAPEPPVSTPGRVVEVEDGLAYVGPDAEVEQASLGPGAILLRGAAVDPGARIEDAIVFAHERVAAGHRVRRDIWFDAYPLGLSSR